MPADAAASKPPLDDLMMAMDVVDTLRHDERIAVKELGDDLRDEQMVERLRQIYTSQGIEVPDRMLREGVQNLRQNRFVYSPPAAGFQRTLALIYVTRARWSKWLGILLLLAVAAVLAWRFLVVLPRERAAEALRIELTETLPADFAALTVRIAEIAVVPEATARAEELAATGLAAVATSNADAARKARADLMALEAQLLQTFDVRIVSRPGTPTGVTRIPQANRSAQNYYLIVEAIGPDGKALPQEIRSEEDGKTERIDIWGQRVPKATFDAVRADKQRDGIVQDAVLGSKARGKLDIDWQKPVDAGAITKW